ncbi:MAG: hypothetical protein AB7S26_01800 [Sandaracinaceae bacterium]
MTTHLTERRLAQIQAISGLVFATFLALHLVNTMIATFGQSTYDAYMRAVRLYYQGYGIELAVVIVAPLVHVTAGILRARRRRAKARAQHREDARVPWRLRLHRWSGIVLAVVFIGHASATRLPGLVFDQPGDFTFVHFSLSQFGFFFYPYYALFALAGVYHLVNGVIAAAPLVGLRLPRAWFDTRSRRSLALALGGALILGVGILALGGAFFDVDTARFVEIEALYDRLNPFE